MTVIEKILSRAEESLSDRLLVVKDGETLIDYGAPHTRLETMSITKSIVALALGFLWDRGLLDLDQPLMHLFPEWDQGQKAQITLRHILNHTSGIYNDPTCGDIYRAPDVVQLALAAELTTAPGETFLYNNKSVCLLAGVVARLAGEPIDTFTETHLFKPLGIKDYFWKRDAMGNPHCLAGLQLTAEDLLKIARLFYAPDTLLSKAWLDALCRPSEVSGKKCGLLWWVYDAPKKMYAAQGYLGQRIFIFPNEDLIGIRQHRKRPEDPAETDEFSDFRTLLAQL